jgi:protein-tyrosine phosphatase
VVDLHVHALPEVDDGPRSVDESLELLRSAHAEGIRVVAATPHLRQDFPGVRVAQIAEHCRALTELLDTSGVALRLVPGAEVDYEWARDASTHELGLASFDQRGSDLLLETPYGPITPAFEDVLFRLAAKGFRVTLAHPERSPTFQAEPLRLEAMVGRGALVQLTAGTLLGNPRRSASVRLAFVLLERGLAHVIASDAHGAATDRSGSLSQAVTVATSHVGDRAEWMVTDAPAAILAGESLPSAPALRGRPGRRLARRVRAVLPPRRKS